MFRVPDKVVARLSLYRRLLSALAAENVDYVYSHELAKAAGASAAQVRRDVMIVGFTGSPTKGYEIRELIKAIGRLLDAADIQEVALVGVGNLGRAILAYFAGRRPNLRIAVSFDKDPAKVDRVIHGCRCYPIEQLQTMVAERQIDTAIVAVPADQAQHAVDLLVGAGVCGLLNFAPVRLRVPPSVFVEDMDLTTSLEKVAFFARRQASLQEQQR
ncbi:MAG: redox-sensing transcriptional repressor Rex [Planctomycetaceae bacterium]|nr:redox-sensing transcriptional repressor Rex [Planctomycetaceae bacterium]